jgi:FecR-like protein
LVSTGADSSLELLFTDQSKFDLGENTTLVISEYQYQTANQTDSFSTRIIKGTFRFVTGLIANDNPSSMEIKLSVATIGIRGTHVVGETTATTAKVILLEPEKPAATAVEVFNQYGSVTIDKAGYGTEVPDQFSPPSPIRRMQMRTIDNLMRSIQNSQRIRRPRL